MSLYVDIKKKFKGFSLKVRLETTGETMGLLGASGCGKSMTLKCIAGIVKPDEGMIRLNDKVLFDSRKKINLPPQERNVGYLFQNYALFPNMTVEENISCGLKGSKKEKQSRVYEMLGLLHIKGFEKRYPVELSGGQQQRVALARILAYEPEVLMLDEPFSALDAYLKESLQQELIESLRGYRGDTLLVSHDRDEVYGMCGSIAVIENGAIVLMGNTKEIFKNPINLAGARLTGCKNISRAKKVSETVLEALDWGITLHTDVIIKDSIQYVGIRAHAIRPAIDSKQENSLPCNLMRVAESPFEQNIIVNSKGSEIWWKISKAYWNNTLKEQLPEYLILPKGALMLLS
ncbi:ABC transporter [Anaerocolumna cellulosilytica]|uniref:ABC transporter n=1 Tax=Anaerocolumna cellulosilytica TaxID=433286 RepID=A0A6S6QZF5_9FIRM|nr:ATP-binding cassette domain-containing protein [Anaerocolumna cellulosilytica]MBB5197964.1 molybdate transport system ATP-binding protein [Anaerocolumna cellulosilytica]BCJ95156.1 ABC transporter [Anaerocolumna cellulosilytica]